MKKEEVGGWGGFGSREREGGKRLYLKKRFS